MVILGGAGSLAGVAIGAIVVNVLLEVLTTPSQARVVFYAFIALGLLLSVRPWRWLAGVAAATLAFGFAVHAIVAATWDRGTEGAGHGGSVLARVARHWIVLPSDPRVLGNYAFVALVASILALTLIRRPWRWLALPPVLYLAAFVWENRLIAEPSVTRLILLGAILVALMHARPQGLLGTTRVEIV
jgi:ABC-type branched-subunit amino acid transport system permease subunit